MQRNLLRAQGAYYILTGGLPLVSMNAFQALTGKKVDRWLVRMVGLLAVSIGVPLCRAAQRDEIPHELVLLAVLSALSFAAIDITYVARRRISPIYLVDAAAELALIAAMASDV